MSSKNSHPVSVSATRFRANLFDYLRQATAGSDVTIQHKNSSFRIVPIVQPSKMERLASLPPLDIGGGSRRDLERAGKRLADAMQRRWHDKWRRRLPE
jgi:antitoxin (DNA-binding transcriptional repressor) of toxin-antitoxin stability system